MESNLHVGFRMLVAVNLMKRQSDSCTYKKQCDQITGNNGWIIGYLMKHQGQDVFQRDLEQEFHVRRSTVSKAIKLMEQKGFIRREAVAQDARLKKILLTDRARQLHQNLEPEMKENERRLIDGIAPEDLAVFSRVLDRMLQNLCEQKED